MTHVDILTLVTIRPKPLMRGRALTQRYETLDGQMTISFSLGAGSFLKRFVVVLSCFSFPPFLSPKLLTLKPDKSGLQASLSPT